LARSAAALLFLLLSFSLSGSGVTSGSDSHGTSSCGDGHGHVHTHTTSGSGLLVLFAHGAEGIFNLGAASGASLDVRHVSVLGAPRINVGLRHLSLLVGLVADADEGEVFRVLGSSIVHKVVSPLGQLIE